MISLERGSHLDGDIAEQMKKNLSNMRGVMRRKIDSLEVVSSNWFWKQETCMLVKVCRRASGENSTPLSAILPRSAVPPLANLNSNQQPHQSIQ